MESIGTQATTRNTKTETGNTRRLGARVLAVLLALLSFSALAGDKLQREGLLIQGPVRAEDTWVGEGTATGVKAKLWVFSKKGADGKELCGSFKCAKSPEDTKG